MSIREGYDRWAEQYDHNENRTRDLEAVAMQTMLAGFSFGNVLEAGCGTGKNSARLRKHADSLTAVDFSEKMLGQAKQKIT